MDQFGLECFPQVFEICDEEQMLGYMAYHGMPAHYPHWSFGKSFEKLKTLYGYGVSGLPYEMVINSNESIAYLMRNNSLCLQILTIAHVYGHNDFFRNNTTFQATHPELTLSNFKSRADRVRRYAEDPAIGADKVEAVLDAAHALSFNCRHNAGVRKLSPAEQRERAIESARPPRDPHQDIHPTQDAPEPNLRRIPLEPEPDILLFIRDHNPYLTTWERDLLTIVHEEAQYFIPQIETKIMNEGWASFWHHRIVSSLDLPADLQMEFMVHHSQVVRPHPGSINPYYLGFRTWHDILRRCEQPTPEERERYGGPTDDMATLFRIREVDRDASFLRQFLSGRLMREMDMYEFGPEDDQYVVQRVADEDNWQQVRDTLINGVGMSGFPVIHIDDADYDGARKLHLSHAYDGRELELGQAEKTLAYLHRLWGREVVLETTLQDKPTRLRYDQDGFSSRPAA
ncbi:SpoVR family protein [Immundisolibacter sp.]|uniref:SpoVR family protein n=1 Tax=Immundisolibacter sp. TaxID=1934948 RepID=UPI00356AB7C3